MKAVHFFGDVVAMVCAEVDEEIPWRSTPAAEGAKRKSLLFVGDGCPCDILLCPLELGHVAVAERGVHVAPAIEDDLRLDPGKIGRREEVVESTSKWQTERRQRDQKRHYRRGPLEPPALIKRPTGLGIGHFCPIIGALRDPTQVARIGFPGYSTLGRGLSLYKLPEPQRRCLQRPPDCAVSSSLTPAGNSCCRARGRGSVSRSPEGGTGGPRCRPTCSSFSRKQPWNFRRPGRSW